MRVAYDVYVVLENPIYPVDLGMVVLEKQALLIVTDNGVYKKKPTFLFCCMDLL